ncbi:hypothetical protein BWI93_13095 [Siphonobacter sp. BAB-5385]|nr:hypothetical protein BWI93_13095 [Siphonobacter sp. BAB-5385]PMD85601.1 hypothetical protein BWI97_26665 [Siphonobacter sp. BAB-5405]
MLASKLKLCVHDKNSKILSIGNNDKYVYFVITGLIRKFYINNGKEVTSSIFTSNDIIISFNSFFNQTTSTEAIETINETELYKLHYEDYLFLAETRPDFIEIMSNITLDHINSLEDYNKLLKIKTPFDRYKMFEKLFPKYRGKLPNSILASYLNISYSEISRIRAKILKSYY